MAARLKLVATGIYRDRRDGSWEIYVRVKPLPLAHRNYPPTLTLDQVKDKRAALQRDLKRAAKHQRPTAGTLAADAEAFLALLVGNPRLQKERRAQLRFWTERFGHLHRFAIPHTAIQEVLAQWAAAGYAYYTIKHRRAGLLALYTALARHDDPPNPVAQTTIPVTKPEPEPRGLPLEVAIAILSGVSSQGGVYRKGDATKPKGSRGGRYEASKTQARINVMAFTGLRHSELKRYVPADWRRDQHELVVRAGKGSDERIVPLSADAEFWLKELEARAATGPFNNGVVERAFRRALAGIGLAPPLPRGQRQRVPAGVVKRRGGRARGRTGLIRPYDLRHTFGTAMYQQTGDLSVTQTLMGHKDIRQTQRYAKNAVAQVQRVAVAKFQAAIAEAKVAQKLPQKVTDAVTDCHDAG